MFATLGLIVAAATAQTKTACAAAAAFTGTICAPLTPGKHPAILLLGGSEGGDRMQYVAPQFAQRGYVAASVAYFGMPGLPKTLENIPVETVGKALEDVVKRADVDPNRIAIMGYSKGGELSLLAASTYPQIHAVVAVVPSPFGWPGIAQGPGSPTPSWTVAGKPVPYVPYGQAMMDLFMGSYGDGKPLDLRKGYDGSMEENKAGIASAMFPLQNIRGPILFVTAGDDQIWNSVAQSQIGLKYLRAHHHPYADRILEYPDAGHLFLFATAQRPMVTAPLGQMTLLLGGTRQSNTRAAAQAWPEIMTFLKSSLGQ